MSQPLQNMLGVHRGIDADKPNREFRGIRIQGGRVHRAGHLDEGNETRPALRDIIALILLLCGLCATVTGAGLWGGVPAALVVLGALLFVLGVLVGVA